MGSLWAWGTYSDGLESTFCMADVQPNRCTSMKSLLQRGCASWRRSLLTRPKVHTPDDSGRVTGAPWSASGGIPKSSQRTPRHDGNAMGSPPLSVDNRRCRYSGRVRSCRVRHRGTWLLSSSCVGNCRQSSAALRCPRGPFAAIHRWLEVSASGLASWVTGFRSSLTVRGRLIRVKLCLLIQ